MTQPFTIQGPDDEGNVWLHFGEELGEMSFNLGPKDEVAETLSEWLASIDHEERDL